MEQTLGKRIAQYRKQMNMTQDQLAEKLGITAQAVSKWENDLSCPDISMLPKLAEIFGVTTDALLGRDAPETVYQGEVVDNEDTPGIHFENENSSWNFHWDSGRKHALQFAICVLMVGALQLASRWYTWDVSFWDILWPTVLLVYGAGGIFPRFSVVHFGMTLFGGYSLIANLGLWHLTIQPDLVFPICVVLFGVSLLIDALRKPKKSKMRIRRKGQTSNKTKCQCSNTGNRFSCDLSFGEKHHLVELPVLSGGEANCCFGELIVDLSGCKEVTENCTIKADCSFGELILLVPRCFSIQSDSNTSFASVAFSGEPDACPRGIIYLNTNVSFGEIVVRYH